MATSKNRFIINSPLILVELFTLLLVGYIAYGEVNRQYPRFLLSTMEAQAETIRNPLDSYLQAGIAIEQYSGFNTQGSALLESDPFIESLRVYDENDKLVYENLAQQAPQSLRNYREVHSDLVTAKGVRFEESAQSYRVMMPLIGKFGPMGRIELETSKQAVRSVVDQEFDSIFQVGLLVFALFTLFVITFDHFSKRSPKLAALQKQILNTVYFVSFLTFTAVIGYSAFQIYDYGARGNAKALADSMAQRISTILELGIELEDITGINQALQDYKAGRPDINTVSISRQGDVLFHTDESKIGVLYQPPPDNYEYTVKVPPGPEHSLHLAVTIPVEVVRDAVLKQSKEFLVLLLACGLMSWIFLDAGTGLLQRLRQDEGTQSTNAGAFEQGLKLVKPAYFLIVFTSALPVSFLPQLVADLSSDASASLASTTLPFTIYYFVFAAVLIPAGRYAEHGSIKKMMGLGFITELIGLLFIALSNDYWPLTIGRIFSGFGQGVFLIGLNSYTLSITPKEKRTIGASVKVNGRNAALISGTAIGALLYTYMDYQMVFMVASAISLVGMLYLFQLVPAVEEIIQMSGIQRVTATVRKTRIKDDILAVVRDGELMKTLLMVGLLGKIAIAGVVMFAIPLVLAKKGFPAAEIGQSLMLFYIASIIVTRFTSSLVDKLGASRNVLFLSTLIGGVGMLLVGLVGIDEWTHQSALPGIAFIGALAVGFNDWLDGLNIPLLSTYLVVGGIVLAGISNGLMAAPVMTHIDKTPVAQQYGNKAVAATYLFLERGGHVVGPMLISSMLLLTHETPLGIAIFGAVTIAMGALFLVTSKHA